MGRKYDVVVVGELNADLILNRIASLNSKKVNTDFIIRRDDLHAGATII